MNENVPTERRRSRWLLPVLLSAMAAAVALPASAALAGGGDGGNGGGGTDTTFRQVQQSPDRSRERPDGHDCPERDGRGDGNDSSASGSPDV